MTILAVDSAPWMYEILIRMKDKDGGLILPGEFIPLAERHRLAFVLKELEGLETKEICNVLEVTGTNLGVIL